MTSWTSRLALGSVAIGALCVLFILQYTKFPYEPYRLFIFDYLFRVQDLPGAAVAIGIALAAAVAGLSRPALALVEAIGRHPWLTAIATFLVLCAGQLLLAHDYALAGDEYLMLMQAKAFASGRLAAQFPPDLVSWVVPWVYKDRWLHASLVTGQVVPAYWPGYAALLAPFVLLGATWACNPLLTAGSLALLGRLATRLTGAPQAAGWAMLLALASPTFTGMALSYFSMAAHLFFNLAFVYLLLERRLFFAGVMGSVALVLSNPVPHLLFALPWWISLAWRDGWRSRLALITGYLPIGLAALGWWLFARTVGEFRFPPYAVDYDPLHRLGNFLFYWRLQFAAVFVEPGVATLAKRGAELVKLWLWTVPGLPVLALAGAVLAWRNVPLRLFTLSFVCTALGFLLVWFDQGYGWGVRYLHPAFGALPLLGAAAIMLFNNAALRRYAAAAALLSVLVATPFRGAQIEWFMADHLSRRPPFEKDAREIVFVTLNWDYYTQDFIQNDPFLRDPVIFMLSRGRTTDEELLREHFPGARLVRTAPFGHVWRLD